MVIGQVNMPANSEDPQLFMYTLPELANGIHTFRIHMVSPDGASLYSDELEIVTSSTNLLLEPPFPNPVSGTASVQFVTKSAQRIQISLYDIAGRELFTVYDGEPGIDRVHEAEIRTDNLASGFYFLRMVGSTSSVTQTLVIRK